MLLPVISPFSPELNDDVGVTHNDNDDGKPATEWRTSTTYFLSSSGHPKLEALDQRVVDLVKVDKSHQEHVQVLR